MELKTLIIDDEPLARKRIRNLLTDINELKLIGECKNGNEAINNIEKFNPDLIFLDIELKDITGFDVLEKSQPQKTPLVVFITAYDEFALKAFDFFAFDYLLKPFKDERFYKTIKKLINHTKKGEIQGFNDKINELLNAVKNPTILDNYNTIKYKLPIKLGNKISFINIDEIKYITASGYYAEIHTDNKKFLLREPLAKLINQLDQNSFSRIHRSTIINIRFVKELINSNYGEMDVKMLDNTIFRISKSYKKEFSLKMGV